MTIHRFFVDPRLFDLYKKEIILPDEISYQIRKVLRLEDGDRIILCDGNKNEWIVSLSYGSIANNKTIGQFNNGRISNLTGRILEQRINMNEPKLFLTLYQALIPREKFEDVLEKCTEIGVSRFVPLETARCQVHAKDVDDKKLQRWQKIITEAAEQSERGIVPVVQPAMKFEQAIETALKNGKALVAWEKESSTSVILSKAKDPLGIKEDSSAAPQNDNNSSFILNPLSLFVGPEGGFHDEEIQFAKLKGAKTISLGPRILRSETAGIIASGLILM